MKNYIVRLGNGGRILKKLVVRHSDIQIACQIAKQVSGLNWYDAWETLQNESTEVKEWKKTKGGKE